MPRGRPKKQTNDNDTKQMSKDEEQKIVEQYSLEFARAMQNAMNSQLFFNPFLQNEILKNVNMNPVKYDRDKIEELIKNPRQNELALRDVAEYLENYVMHFKRLVFYYGCILTFDNYLEPSNADEEDMKSPSFKKSYKKAVEWLDKFNIKKSFTDVLRMVISEDAVYFYVRESDAGISLQQMPSKWCKIVRKTDYGYQYAFNMTYFLQTGINLDDYAPEFRDYYNELTSNEAFRSGNSNPFWVELDPIKAPVFKFDENRAGSVPPLMGLFVDSTEIATYKELLKTKTKLDVWKVLLSKIPMQTDGKSNAKNNFAIDAKTAAQFNTVIQKSIPQGTTSIVTPFETTAVDFKQSENKNDIAGIGENMFYRSSGSSPILFGDGNTTGSGIKASITTDEAFISHVYFIFERFLNTQLKRVTGKYRFKIHLEGTIFDREERFDRALQAANSGAPKTYLAVAMGKTVDEFINLSNFENSINLINKLKPLLSAHTQTGEGGRPQKSTKKLSDSGQQTRDDETNQNR